MILGDSTCMLWDIESGQSKITFNDHDGDVMSVSILPAVNPNMFISGQKSLKYDHDFRVFIVVMIQGTNDYYPRKRKEEGKKERRRERGNEEKREAKKERELEEGAS